MKPSGSDPDFKNGPERFLANQILKENYRFLLKTRDAIRNWLKSRGYLEMVLPALSPETVPDLNLESFPVNFQSVFDRRKKRRLFLQTSPELLLKRMMAAGFENIFYLGPAFRQGEFSAHHHPEFTMAEWYHKGADYQFLMAELEAMLSELCGIKKPIAKMTMREAMSKAADLDFLELTRTAQLARLLAGKIPGLKTSGMDWADLFELALVELLDPWLKNQGVIFIYDWPAPFAMQGKLKDDDSRLCERFELYLNGIEVANGYTENTHPEEMLMRLKAEMKKRKKLGRSEIPLPEKFLGSLRLGLPPCAGVSLGLERLCLALLRLESLDQLIPFREI